MGKGARGGDRNAPGAGTLAGRRGEEMRRQTVGTAGRSVSAAFPPREIVRLADIHILEKGGMCPMFRDNVGATTIGQHRNPAAICGRKCVMLVVHSAASAAGFQLKASRGHSTPAASHITSSASNQLAGKLPEVRA
jgi:hypothetical protein